MIFEDVNMLSSATPMDTHQIRSLAALPRICAVLLASSAVAQWLDFTVTYVLLFVLIIHALDVLKLGIICMHTMQGTSGFENTKIVLPCANARVKNAAMRWLQIARKKPRAKKALPALRPTPKRWSI